MLRALVSIHDLMPETRPAVSAMLDALQRGMPRLPPTAITLLVVPGKQWSESDLQWLRQLVQTGHPLAGHGWSHRSPLPRSAYHWAHSVILSRRVAEHLSRTPQSLIERIARCHQWFDAHHLPSPTLYVPPAWATGNLNLEQWRSLPFRQLETLRGVHCLDQDNPHILPLSGYEADSPLRTLFLRHFNRYNLQRAQHSGQPLRIALHPFDLQYALAQNALQDLAAVDEFLNYSQLSGQHAI